MRCRTMRTALVAVFAAAAVCAGGVASAQTELVPPGILEPTPPPPEQERQPEPSYPAPPANSGDGRRIVYAVSAQRVWLVEEDGRVASSYLVSGRAGVPKPATYKVFSRSRYSSAGSVRMEYMTRFAKPKKLAIGFHSIPTRKGKPIQSESELGQYRSHGCVRQKLSDAAALWDWAPIGTKVVVLR